MKQITMLILLLCRSIAGYADQAIQDDAITALCMISSQGDYIGEGRSRAYYETSGRFTINTNNHYGVTIQFVAYPKGKEHEYTENWRLEFSAPGNQPLQLGIYKHATRNAFHKADEPGIEISGCGRGSNTTSGEFEILELEYDIEGKIMSFAANFVQGELSPLIGSIRYHSSIPIEARFKEIFGPSPSVIFITKRNPITGNQTAPVFITEKDCSIDLLPLPYGGEGVEILISGSRGKWVFDFAAPTGSEFIQGKYENPGRYPFQGHFTPGIDVTTPRGTYRQPQGAFKVLDVRKDYKGQIKSLTLNFIVENEEGEILEGAIRYQSDTGIDISHPYVDDTDD